MSIEGCTRDAVEGLWRAINARDFEAAGDLLHDDFVCEWPQSRERIRGRANFIAVNRDYPGNWSITVRRVVASGDEAVTEVIIRIDGRTDVAVSFFELRDGQILRETVYWPEPYDAPEWRARWVEAIESDGQ